MKYWILWILIVAGCHNGLGEPTLDPQEQEKIEETRFEPNEGESDGCEQPDEQDCEPSETEAQESEPKDSPFVADNAVAEDVTSNESKKSVENDETFKISEELAKEILNLQEHLCEFYLDKEPTDKEPTGRTICQVVLGINGKWFILYKMGENYILAPPPLDEATSLNKVTNQ